MAHDLTSLSSLPVIAGDLILDAECNPNAVFIFKMTTTLSTAANRHVILINGTSSNNIYWRTGTAATFDEGCTMHGNVFAETAITYAAGCTHHGRYVSNTLHTAIFCACCLAPLFTLAHLSLVDAFSIVRRRLFWFTSSYADICMHRAFARTVCTLITTTIGVPEPAFVPAQCSVDTYSSVDNTECTECAANATSPAGSSNMIDCACVAGFTGLDGGPCEMCAEGKYKAVNGSSNCLECNPGTISAPSSVTCTQCSESTYSSVDHTKCLNCVSNATSPTGSSKTTDCTCIAGFTGPDGGPCIKCVAGKHKIAPGDATCSSCTAGQYSTVVGAISDVCQRCPSNSNAPEASDKEVDCTCNAGSMSLDGGNCTQCDDVISIWRLYLPGDEPGTSRWLVV